MKQHIKHMNKIIFVSLFSLLLAGTVTGQTQMRLNENRKSIQEQPLVVIDSVVCDLEHVLISPNNIESIDILKDSAATAVYGEKAKYGVLIIRTKKNKDIFHLNELLDQYHIPVADRSLLVCIDNVLVKDASKIIADKTQIVGAEVKDDMYWISPNQPGPEKRHINLVTARNNKF